MKVFRIILYAVGLFAVVIGLGEVHLGLGIAACGALLVNASEL